MYSTPTFSVQLLRMQTRVPRFPACLDPSSLDEQPLAPATIAASAKKAPANAPGPFDIQTMMKDLSDRQHAAKPKKRSENITGQDDTPQKVEEFHVRPRRDS
jgi:hypothetical protein